MFCIWRLVICDVTNNIDVTIFMSPNRISIFQYFNIRQPKNKYSLAEQLNIALGSIYVTSVLLINQFTKLCSQQTPKIARRVTQYIVLSTFRLSTYAMSCFATKSQNATTEVNYIDCCTFVVFKKNKKLKDKISKSP